MPGKKARKKPNRFSALWKRWQSKPGRPWPEKSKARWRELFNGLVQDYCRKNRITGELREALLDLSHESQGMRLVVMQDFIKMPKKKAAKAAPLLRILLKKDPNANIRSSAAIHLGYLEAKEAVPDLIRSLELERDKNVATDAASALGRLKDKRAVPALVKAVAVTGNQLIDRERKADSLRRTAAISLGEIAPKLVKGKTALEKFKIVSKRAESLFPYQAGLLKFLIATDPRLRAKMPSSLTSKAERHKVHYLDNFINGLRARSFEEALSLFGFEGAKKVNRGRE